MDQKMTDPHLAHRFFQNFVVNKNKGHEQALKEELLFRGVSYADGAGFLQLKKLLVNHELSRSNDAGAAAKSFKRLSNAIFVGIDIDRTEPDTVFFLAEDINKE